jgi:hypothetical protein
VSTYCDFFYAFTIVTIRCFEQQPPVYDIPLTDSQKNSLSHFLTVLRANGNILPPLEDFLFSICEQQPPQNGLQTWTCPMQCFWAVHALRDDGNFVPPELFTGWLTKSKHLCILTTALHAIKHIPDHPTGLIG